MISKIFYFICAFFLVAGIINAQEANTGEIDARINELKAKIAELQGKENTLSTQIAKYNSQITLKTLSINSIKATIAKLQQEADQLADEIERLETMLTKRTELFISRIPESYKRKSVSQFGMVLFSDNLSDFLNRIKYISDVQSQDMLLLTQLKKTQNNFSERKALREQKKQQQEEQKLQLELETKELEILKKDRQILLTQTRNSEVEYQKLLSQALAERQALERALVEGVKVGPIKKGDPIALVGNTGYPGCSTGAHLHFEVRKNNAWTDPGGYLSSKSVSDEQNGGNSTLGSGSWDWPISDTIRLTQHYGKTPYSWRYAYSGGIHTGYDMVSTAGDVIRAPADGTLYSSSQGCGSSSVIKIKYIDHGDSVLSFYLHVQ